MPRERMEQEILEFIREHPESTASLAVARRILGDPRDRSGMHATVSMVDQLQQRIDQVDGPELEACYYIIR